MRPSIMSDGATMSTPASACTSACRTSSAHGLVVQHVAVGVQHAVLAVAGVGVERDVGQDAEFGKALLQFAHRARHQALRDWSLRCRPAFSACGSMTGNSASTGIPSATQSSATASSRSTDSRSTPGIEADLLALVLSVQNEDRVDQVGRRHRVFAHQGAGKGVAPHAAHAEGGKAGRGGTGHGTLQKIFKTNHAETAAA